MVNYGNGKIYKIVRLSDDVIVYVGSTTKHYLCSRLVEHKNKAKRFSNRRVYKSVNENGGWENHAIILIELCDCDSKDELHRKEREFIELLKPIGNLQIPLRTLVEWRIENKEKLNQKSKQYHIDNKEKLNQKSKQYHIDNKEIIKQKSKQYHIDNKEKLKEYKKQYSVENREKLNQIINCSCGKTYTHNNKSRHNKTKIHINKTPKPAVNIL